MHINLSTAFLWCRKLPKLNWCQPICIEVTIWKLKKVKLHFTGVADLYVAITFCMWNLDLLKKIQSILVSVCKFACHDVCGFCFAYFKFSHFWDLWLVKKKFYNFLGAKTRCICKNKIYQQKYIKKYLDSSSWNSKFGPRYKT